MNLRSITSFFSGKGQPPSSLSPEKAALVKKWNETERRLAEVNVKISAGMKGLNQFKVQMDQIALECSSGRSLSPERIARLDSLSIQNSASVEEYLVFIRAAKAQAVIECDTLMALLDKLPPSAGQDVAGEARQLLSTLRAQCALPI